MVRLPGSRGETAADAVRDTLHGDALHIIAAGVIIAILYWARLVFITTMSAVVIALILEPFVGFLTKLRIPRVLAAGVVCFLALAVLWISALAAWNQMAGIVSEAPALKENMTRAVEGVSSRIQLIEDAATNVLLPSRKEKALPPPPVAPLSPPGKKSTRKSAATTPPAATGPAAIPEVRIHDDSNPIEDYILTRLENMSRAILISTFVPLLVFFMLSWRDHIHKSFLRFFEGPARVTVSQSLQGIAGVARAFVVGNFIIGVLLAVATSAIFAVLRLPYPLLAGVLSGCLSLVPYAGMFLAALPPLLAGFATGAPTSILIFAVITAVVLHLIAMNVLYPTIVGARVHLNPLVVTFSLMFWGFLWDAAGLVLAIPITAGIKAVCDHVEGLRKYGRFLGD